LGYNGWAFLKENIRLWKKIDQFIGSIQILKIKIGGFDVFEF